MPTSKPISTISYNTVPFLHEKLLSLYDNHVIQAYMYIYHKGEDGDKDHIHLRIEPNKKLDPMDLTELFSEFQIGKDKPLGCRPWRPSKEEDWFLYVVHDSDYLMWKYNGGDKGEKLPYDYHDIVVSPMYDLDIAFIRARSSLQHSSFSLARSLTEGVNPLNLILQGENVFTLNAVMRAVSASDYQRLQVSNDVLNSRYTRLVQRYNFLVQFLSDQGYKVVDDDDFSKFHVDF